MSEQLYLIKNGILHYPDRAPSSGEDILVEGTRIKKIGLDIDAPKAEIVEASGKHVFPGFILPLTSVGISDYANLRQGDSNESPKPINTAVHVRHALDVREVALQGYRRSGITCFGAAPGKKGLIAGQMGLYHSYGRRTDEMCVRETVALKGNFTFSVKETFNARQQAPMTRMGMASLLMEAFRKAQVYDPEKEEPDPDMEVLTRVLKGELPLLMNADLTQEIESVISIANMFDLKLILHGGYLAHLLPELLLQGPYPLILGDLVNNGAAVEYETNLKAMLALRDQGLPFALSNSGDGGAGHESLLWGAFRMVQEGLDPEDAARMLTIDIARILGVDDLVGSLKEGKYADIVIYPRHPFESWDAPVEFFMVRGRVIAKEEENALCC